MGKRALGFTTNVAEPKKHSTRYELLQELQPDDLIKYGLIPEFVGRLPVSAPLEELDESALVRILVEPKNALIKQYEEMLRFDNVKLIFTPGALTAIAQLAIKRKTGARGLRSILEEAMTDIMYSIPSRSDVKEVVVNEEVIDAGAEPILVFHNQDQKELA